MAMTEMLILLALFLGPPTILIGGLFAFMKMKRQTRLLVKLGDKEFKWFPPVIYNNIISTSIMGKKVKWEIDKKVKPSSIHTGFGMVPFYYAETGRALTSDIAESSKTIMTEENLNDLEEQSILKALFKMDMMGAEGIMMLVGAAAVGLTIGIIVSKMILFKNCA
jgi:hypothetical protein